MIAALSHIKLELAHLVEVNPGEIAVSGHGAVARELGGEITGRVLAPMRARMITWRNE
jgi:hypothetical protein